MIILLLIGALFLFYVSYQFIRNEKVFKIRINWIETDDERYHKYTYNEMMKPNVSNWFGLKFPQDKDY